MQHMQTTVHIQRIKLKGVNRRSPSLRKAERLWATHHVIFDVSGALPSLASCSLRRRLGYAVVRQACMHDTLGEMLVLLLT